MKLIFEPYFLSILNWNFAGYTGSKSKSSKYRTRAIISRGLYIFYPISKDNFFIFKEVFLIMTGYLDWGEDDTLSQELKKKCCIM